MKSLISKALFFLLFVWFGGYITFYVLTVRLNQKTPLRVKADAIAVLTGDQGRIHHGLWLLEQRAGKKLMISGVSPGQASVKNKNITLGFEAKNTVGNALEIKHWLEKNHFQSCYIVTSDYHMIRSLLEVQNKAPHVVFFPAPVKSKASFYSYKLFQEYHKLIFSFFKQFIEKMLTFLKHHVF